MSHPGFHPRHPSQDSDHDSQPSDAFAGAWPEISEHSHDVLRQELIRARLFGDPDAVVATARVGRYAVLEHVGSGAMSVVFAAYDRELDRKVAIKLLRSDVATPDRIARLRREAQALGRLSHPNVVAIHDVGAWNEQVFLAMEFVPGSRLAEWQAEEPPRTWREILDVYVQGGHGLAAAHAAGLVHRDFKPANVLIGDDRRVRVVDFGLVGAAPAGTTAVEDLGCADVQSRAASHVDRPALDVDRTTTCATLGTPAYMAPEQFASARVDARADQFSFCLALYEALCRIHGWAQDELDALRHRIQRGSPLIIPSDGGVPQLLYRILQRGLLPDVCDRYPSMAALLANLERVANAPRRRRRLALATIGATAVVAVVTGTVRWSAQRVERERTQARCAKAVAAAENIVGTEPTEAAVLLRDAPCPESDPGWAAAASGTLQLPVAATVLHGMPGTVNSVMFSPDGRYLAASAQSDVTQIWRRGPDGLIRASPELILPGGSFQFSARGDQIVTLSSTGTVRLWELIRPDSPRAVLHSGTPPAQSSIEFLPDGAGLFWFTAEGKPMMWRPGGKDAWAELEHEFVDFSWPRHRSGRHVVRWGAGGELELWRITGAPIGAERRFLPQRSCPASSGAVSPDGRHLYVGCSNGDIERWDLKAKGVFDVWHGHSAKIHHLEVARDGRVLTVSHDGTARVWSPGEEPSSEIVSRHEGSILYARFSPDGQRVLTFKDGQAQVLELVNSRDVTPLKSLGLVGHGSALSPDGLHAAVGYTNGVVRVWQLRRKNSSSLRGHEQGIWSAELDRDGARLVTASFDGTVRMWDLAGSEPPLVFRGHGAPGDTSTTHVYAARFDPLGKRIASGAKDGTAQIWRADGGGEPIVLPGHEVWAYALAWSPDGHWLATGSQHGAVRLWNADGGEPIVLAPPVPSGSTRIHGLAFSPDGTRLVSVRFDGLVQMWDLAAGHAVTELRCARCASYTVAFSPDGRLVAVNDGNTVLLLDGHNLSVRARLDKHEDNVLHVTFSPDGRRLLSASSDGTARVWRTDGRLEHTFYSNTTWVVTAAFDPAGERVVTGARDGIVHVWRLSAPSTPIVLRGHRDEVRFVAFTPDGEQVITAAMDGTARVWTVPPHPDGASLRRQVRAATTACLTPNRRIQHLGESEATARRHAEECARRMVIP